MHACIKIKKTRVKNNKMKKAKENSTWDAHRVTENARGCFTLVTR